MGGRSLKNLPTSKCRRQVVVSLGAVLVLFALSTIYGLFRINSIGANVKAVAEGYIPLTQIVTEIGWYQREQSMLLERALCLMETMAVKAEERHRLEETIKAYETLSGKVDEKVKKGVQLAENAVLAAPNDEQRNAFEEIGRHLTKIGQEHQDVDQQAGEVFVLVQEGRLRDAHAMLEMIEQEEGQLAHELEAFLMRVEGLTEQAALSAEHSEEQAYLWMIVLTAFAFSAVPEALYAIRRASP